MIKYKVGDLIGPYQMLLIERTTSSPGHSKGMFQCSQCETPFEADIYHVKNGKIKYCKQCRKNARSGKNNSNFKDLTGQRFGKLTVQKYLGSKIVGVNPPQKRNFWELICDCGKVVEKTTNELTTGHISSCGQCSLKSNGEWAIKNILEQNNIKYEAQKYFSTCYRTKGKLCSFDFYLPEYNTCIEYDGISHYTPNPNGGWNTRESVESQKERDLFKNNWCKKNNICLIRIPYTHLSSLTLKDILPEMSTFIVT